MCDYSSTSPIHIRPESHEQPRPVPAILRKARLGRGPFAEGEGGRAVTTHFAKYINNPRYGPYTYGTGAGYGRLTRLARRAILAGRDQPAEPSVDLSTEIFRTSGRARKPVSALVIRELEASDLVLLDAEKGSKAPPLKRLSERHHSLARLLAGGMGSGEAAIVCGYVPSRVSILLDDPAFQELLSFYRSDVQSQYLGMHAVLAGLSRDAATELHDRLEADMQLEEKKIPIGQLVELTKLGADRTGFGPQSSATNINLNVDLAGRLEAARKRVAARRELPEPGDDIDAAG